MQGGVDLFRKLLREQAAHKAYPDHLLVRALNAQQSECFHVGYTNIPPRKPSHVKNSGPNAEHSSDATAANSTLDINRLSLEGKRSELYRPDKRAC